MHVWKFMCLVCQFMFKGILSNATILSTLYCQLLDQHDTRHVTNQLMLHENFIFSISTNLRH